MRCSKSIDAITIVEDGFEGAYPPLGFKQIWEAELGNGDSYGLYWPFGRESDEPIVCDMLHDEWGLEVAFSSVSVFVKWLEMNDGVRGDNEVDDPNLVSSRFQSAKKFLQGHPEKAITVLQGICSDFPEHSEYWFTLASQLRRIGDKEGSAQAVVSAFASNWVFAMPTNGTLRLLQAAKNIPSLADDPLVARSSEINMSFGGAKENSVYEVFKDCITQYLASSNPLRGILLNQNYGYMMMMETKSFQERNEFQIEEWGAEQSELCLKHLGDNRKSIN